MDMKMLSQILAEVLHVDSREVTRGMTLEEDLDVDSLDLFQIMQRVEEESGVSVSGTACRKLRTVNDILRLVDRGRLDRQHEIQ